MTPQHTTNLLRNANVSITSTQDDRGNIQAVAQINDYVHIFEPSSRVSKSLKTMTENDLADRLNGGQFFFVNDELFDYRGANYNGFVHDDDSINKLSEVVGINDATVKNMRVHKNTISHDYVLGSLWSSNEISVPNYKDGGEYQNELHFGWSPFNQTINSAFMLYRLICQNGMRGVTSFLNAKVPVVNRWEEHLDIASMQIQNKINSTVSSRMVNMGVERATVAETMLIADHARTRMTQGEGGSKELSILKSITQAVDPEIHLGGTYKDNVFEDSRIADQMPAHLTTYDAYNIITEIRSHTGQTKESTNNALDKMANIMVFDRKDMVDHTIRNVNAKPSEFADPEMAFWGVMH